MATRLANKHPAIFMVVATYVWTWSFWFLAFSVLTEPQGLKLAVFLLGAFGPAVGGVLTLRLMDGERSSGQMRWTGFLVGAGFAVIALACFRFNVLGVVRSVGPSRELGLLEFPADSPVWVYLLMVLVPLVSGFVFASTQSRDQRLRSYFAGLVPDRRTLILAIPVLLFFPVLLIASNLIATAFGMEYPLPRYMEENVSAWLPVMCVKLFTVAMLTGGNEEHGWRGVLQPLLQKSMNPLVATLIIGVVWELWHLPLVLNGVYGEGAALPIVISRMIGIVPIAYLLTFIYNGSRGSVFLCVLSHACMNSQIAYFAGSPLASVIGAGIIVAIVIKQRWWRSDVAYVPKVQN